MEEDVDIIGEDGSVFNIREYLDVGFTKGPGDYDYYNIVDNDSLGNSKYGQGTWDFTTAPPTFTEEFTFDTIEIDSNLYRSYGVEFSPVKRDSNTSFGMMLAGTDDGIYQVPLKQNTNGFFEPVPGTSELFCGLNPESPTGDLRFIPSGEFFNDLLFVDYRNSTISILKLDNETGNPIDVNSNQPESGTANPLTIPFASFQGDLSSPWGMAFDPVTNDLFVSNWGIGGGGPDEAYISQFRGCPPGIDVGSVTNEIVILFERITIFLNPARRRTLRKSKSKSKTVTTCGVPQNNSKYWQKSVIHAHGSLPSDLRFVSCVTVRLQMRTLQR